MPRDFRGQTIVCVLARCLYNSCMRILTRKTKARKKQLPAAVWTHPAWRLEARYSVKNEDQKLVATTSGEFARGSRQVGNVHPSSAAVASALQEEGLRTRSCRQAEARSLKHSTASTWIEGVRQRSLVHATKGEITCPFLRR
jgi:hypothetical protein